jgi:hypothetical protein
VGGSSGAVIAAAASWLASADRPLSTVCVCPDHGDLYLGSIFQGAWAGAQQALSPAELVACPY